MYPHVLLWFVQPCFPGGGTWNPGNLLEMQLVIFSGKCDGNWVYPYHQFLSSSYGRVGCFKKPLEEWIVPGIQGQPLSLEIDWLKITSGKLQEIIPIKHLCMMAPPKSIPKVLDKKMAMACNGYITIQASIPKWQHSTPSVPAIQLKYLPISKVNTIPSKLNSHVPWSKNIMLISMVCLLFA